MKYVVLLRLEVNWKDLKGFGCKYSSTYFFSVNVYRSYVRLRILIFYILQFTHFKIWWTCVKLSNTHSLFLQLWHCNWSKLNLFFIFYNHFSFPCYFFLCYTLIQFTFEKTTHLVISKLYFWTCCSVTFFFLVMFYSLRTSCFRSSVLNKIWVKKETQYATGLFTG